MNNEKSAKANNFFDPKKTKTLQNDWQSYGKATASYGLVVLFFTVMSILYETFMR